MKHFIRIVAGMVCLLSCTKIKQDDNILQPGGINTASSSIRLYNLYGSDLDVTVNNIPLTSYDPNIRTGTGQGVTLFPSGAWGDGNSFTLPNTLLNKNGTASIHLENRVNVYNPISGNPLFRKDTLLTDNPVNPVDYFVMYDGTLRAIPRAIAAPSRPDRFKIRVLNMALVTDTNQMGGPVTLTYADGSMVDAGLSNIQPGASTGYVELPYGAFEFKLFASQGTSAVDFSKEYAEYAVKPTYMQTPPTGPVYDQECRFSPLRVYKPGGAYTILISPATCSYLLNDGTGNNSFNVRLNTYRYLSDNSPAVNNSFARIQGVNTYPGDAADQVSFRVDGDGVPGGQLAFGKSSGYSIVTTGAHTVQALDASGRLLVQKDVNFYPFDNITAWVYEKNGKPDICFSGNDMSAAGNSIQYRFMNLCPDVAWASFTDETGAPFTVKDKDGYLTTGYDTASTNVPLGEAITHFPYGRIGNALYRNDYNYDPAREFLPWKKIMAFSSSPGPPIQVPGYYLPDIAPLSLTDWFVANPAMYPTGHYNTYAEPGVYTIALAGKRGASGNKKAQILLIKHSK